jgi:hypothetical protein
MILLAGYASRPSRWCGADVSRINAAVAGLICSPETTESLNFNR